ncbi:hypothetical protein FQR65_LT10099 [Abscondita terminalis]|nr:hypothetical protein FQR65_LT10099 [Abscondita terminalis]
MLIIPRSTLCDAIQGFMGTGSCARRPGQGRRLATNELEDFCYSFDQSVRRGLKEHKLAYHPRLTKLTAEHRRQRLEFAQTDDD